MSNDAALEQVSTKMAATLVNGLEGEIKKDAPRANITPEQKEALKKDIVAAIKETTNKPTQSGEKAFADMSDAEKAKAVRQEIETHPEKYVQAHKALDEIAANMKASKGTSFRVKMASKDQIKGAMMDGAEAALAGQFNENRGEVSQAMQAPTPAPARSQTAEAQTEQTPTQAPTPGTDTSKTSQPNPPAPTTALNGSVPPAKQTPQTNPINLFPDAAALMKINAEVNKLVENPSAAKLEDVQTLVQDVFAARNNSIVQGAAKNAVTEAMDKLPGSSVAKPVVDAATEAMPKVMDKAIQGANASIAALTGANAGQKPMQIKQLLEAALSGTTAVVGATMKGVQLVASTTAEIAGKLGAQATQMTPLSLESAAKVGEAMVGQLAAAQTGSGKGAQAPSTGRG